MPHRLAHPCAVLALLALLGGLGCAPSTAPGAADATSTVPVQLPLELATGEATDLARLRGRPALLFLFTTYDTACQLALELLGEMQTQPTALQLMGIAVQPDAATFLPPYASALDVRFPLAFDPSGTLLRGETSLGAVPAVPYYLLVDSDGFVQATHVGVLELDALHAFVEPVMH